MTLEIETLFAEVAAELKAEAEVRRKRWVHARVREMERRRANPRARHPMTQALMRAFPVQEMRLVMVAEANRQWQRKFLLDWLRSELASKTCISFASALNEASSYLRMMGWAEQWNRRKLGLVLSAWIRRTAKGRV